MRDNQTCVMNADSNQGFAAAARATGKTAQAAGRSRGHRPTCDGEQNPRSRYRTETVSWQIMSCVVAVTRVAWRPREHTWDEHVEDDRVQQEGPLQPRLVPLRVHEGGTDLYRNFSSSKMP